MNFDLEGILDSAKEKVVDEATEKFGDRATPIAEEVAGKMEGAIAQRMGIPLHHDAPATNDKADAADDADTSDDSNS